MKRLKLFLCTVLAVVPSLACAQVSTWQTDNRTGICGMSSNNGPLTFANSGHGLFMIVKDWKLGDSKNAEIQFSSKTKDLGTEEALQFGVSNGVAVYGFSEDGLIGVLAGLLGANVIIVNLGDRFISESLDGSSSALMAMSNCVSDIPH